MRDVPERGRPDTTMISGAMRVYPLEVSRLDVDVEHATKTEGGDHGHDEPVDHPDVGAAGPRRARGVIDFDRPDGGVGGERLLPRVQECLLAVPPRPPGADPHEAVAGRQLLVDGLVAHLE